VGNDQFQFSEARALPRVRAHAAGLTRGVRRAQQSSWTGNFQRDEDGERPVVVTRSILSGTGGRLSRDVEMRRGTVKVRPVGESVATRYPMPETAEEGKEGLKEMMRHIEGR